MRIIIELTKDEEAEIKAGEEWTTEEFNGYIIESVNDSIGNYIYSAEVKVI